MDAALEGGSAATAPAASAPGAGKPAAGAPEPARAAAASGAKPAWVDNPKAAYPERQYLAFVGLGTTRGRAEADALRNLVAYFGQSVQSDISIVDAYKEKVANGVVDVSSFSAASSAIETSSHMESLIGAEIGAVWLDDKTKNYYAVAVMDMAKTAAVYGGLIDANQRQIEKLVTVPAADRNTIETVERFYLAGSIAKANEIFGTVLSLLGGPKRSGELKTQMDYNEDAKAIIRQIPVTVSVEGDSAGRIAGAFAQALKDSGFRTGNRNARYKIEATVTVTPVVLQNVNKFSRYVVDAQFLDTANGTALFPFNINGREGHSTQEEADNRAIRAAETKIKADYQSVLAGYLAGTVSD
jgi:hypothetical protein